MPNMKTPAEKKVTMKTSASFLIFLCICVYGNCVNIITQSTHFMNAVLRHLKLTIFDHLQCLWVPLLFQFLHSGLQAFRGIIRIN